MDNEKDKNEKDLMLYKNSVTIQIRNSMGLLARKSWNVLLRNAYNDLKDKTHFEMRAMDLMKLLNMNTRDYKYLEKCLRQLITAIEFNILNKDKSRTWIATALLQHVELKRGIVSYQYGEFVQKCLIANEMYAKINLKIQNKLTSKYALALWEICRDYYMPEKEVSYSPKMEIEQFKLLLLGTRKKYSQKNSFRKFNEQVIKKAVQEVNDKTDINITSVFKIHNRKVIGIQFEIRKGYYKPKDTPVQTVPKEKTEKNTPWRRKLHDGGHAVKICGVWVDERDPSIKINTQYYPELLK